MKGDVNPVRANLPERDKGRSRDQAGKAVGVSGSPGLMPGAFFVGLSETVYTSAYTKQKTEKELQDLTRNPLIFLARPA